MFKKWSCIFAIVLCFLIINSTSTFGWVIGDMHTGKYCTGDGSTIDKNKVESYADWETAYSIVVSLGLLDGMLLSDGAGVFSAIDISADVTTMFGSANNAAILSNIGAPATTECPLDSDYSANGLQVRTGPGAYTVRTLTATVNETSVTAGDGASGNPTIGIADNPIMPGDEKTRLSGGTTGTRPASPVFGDIRWNSSIGVYEWYDGSAWKSVLDSGDIGVAIQAYHANLAAIAVSLAGKGYYAIAVKSDASGLEYTRDLNLASLTMDRTATPGTIFRCSGCTDSDDNAKIYATLTDPGSGTEDIDLHIQVQEAGALADKIFIDADGNIELLDDCDLASGKVYKINDTQIDLDDINNSATSEKIAAADVNAAGHVDIVYDSDGTGAMQITGLGATRIFTAEDAAQKLIRGGTDVAATDGDILVGDDTDWEAVEWVEAEPLPIGWCTDGAAPPAAVLDHTNGNGTVEVRKFSGTTTENVYGVWEVPLEAIDSGAGAGFQIKYRVKAVMTESDAFSDKGISFDLAAECAGDNDSIGVTLAPSIESYKEGSYSQHDWIVTNWVEVTVANGAAGEAMHFELERDHDEAHDDYAFDVGTAFVQFKFKVDRANITY